MLSLIYMGIGAFILLVLICTSFVFVREKHAKIIERLGVYYRTARPGLSLKIPFIDTVIRPLLLKVFEHKLQVDTRTQDKAIVTLGIRVLYRVDEFRAEVYEYQALNPDAKMESILVDIVRAEIPKLTLDDVFETKDEIAEKVKERLGDLVVPYAIMIESVLLIDIIPDPDVAEAMNRINIAERAMVAAEKEGEATKIKAIKEAEADSESKRLQGEGTARQRIAIAEGLKQAVKIQTDAGLTPQEGKELVVLTQYFDTLRDVGANGKNSTIMMPLTSNPGELFPELVKAAAVHKELR